MTELYSDEDTNYYYLSSDDEPEPNTNDLFALLPTDLNTLIYSFLTMKETLTLSETCKSLIYLSKDDASIWKKPLPSDLDDVHSVYIHGHSKIRLSLYNIGLVEGDKAKWIMYNYIKEKKLLNDRKYDMKIFNSILVGLRTRIDRIRQNTTRIDLKHEYAKGCERKKIIDNEKDHYHYRERSVGKFKRSFNLPESINRDKIHASFKNGILSIELEKHEEIVPKEMEISIS